MATCECFSKIAKSRVNISFPSSTNDGFGGVVEGYSSYGDYWVSLESKQGKSFTTYGIQSGSSCDYIMIARYDAAFGDTASASRARVTVGSRKFDVAWAAPLAADYRSDGKFFVKMGLVERKMS